MLRMIVKTHFGFFFNSAIRLVNAVVFISVGTLGCDEGSILLDPTESPQTHIVRRQMAKKEKKISMNATLILNYLLINKIHQQHEQCVRF